MCEQTLTDGWGSYYTAGSMCHLLPVACLLLLLVPFMPVIIERMHGQTAFPVFTLNHMKTHAQVQTSFDSHRKKKIVKLSSEQAGDSTGTDLEFSVEVTVSRFARGHLTTLM